MQVGAPQAVDVVPASAVRNAGGSSTEVVICEGGKAHPQAVVVGERRDGLIEIVSGLESYDGTVRVATDGLTGLEEGTALEESP